MFQVLKRSYLLCSEDIVELQIMALSATFDDQLITTTDINDSSASNWDALYCSHLWSDSNLRREVINATYTDGKVIKYCYTCKGKIRKYEIRSPRQDFVPNNHSTPIPKITIKNEESYNRPANTSFRHTDNVSSVETGQSIPTISHHIDTSFRHKYTTYEMRPHEVNRRRIRKSLKGIGCIVNLALIDSPVKKRTQIQACSISVMIIAIVVISFILVNFTTPSFTNPNDVVTSTIVVPTMSSNETSSTINKYNKTIQSVNFNDTEQVAITEKNVMPISNSISTETTNIEVSDKVHKESKLGEALDSPETSTNLPPDFCSCQTIEICMLETTTGEGICRTPLDQEDPTGINKIFLIVLYLYVQKLTIVFYFAGCGGLCALNNEACREIDKATGLKYCMSLLGPTSSCVDDEWQCRNSRCVPAEARCNGTPQCYDKSDEMNCGTYALCLIKLVFSCKK